VAFDLGALLLTLAVMVAGAGAARWLFGRMKLPGVVGEITFGILLGPSLLGWAWPTGHAALFPQDGAVVLQALAWLGLVLFVYRVGLELDWTGSARPMTMVAAGGLVVPMAVGLMLPLAVPGWFFPGESNLASLAMVGIVLTVSALPVLARVLQDLGLMGTPLASLTVGAASIDDIVGWLLIALVSGSSVALAPHDLGINLLLVIAFGAALLAGQRIFGHKLRNLTTPHLGLVFVPILALALLGAWVTHVTGLNAVLGPLAVGAMVARYPALREDSIRRLGDITRILLLPIFFVVSGAEVDLRLLPLPESLAPLLFVVAAASVAKITGCAIGARLSGSGWRQALAAGSLLNVRGAVGLVVVKVGLDAGIFSPRGYALLVLVVAITTMLSPILGRYILRDKDAAAAAAGS